MSIVAQSPSHRGEIVELFVRDAAALLLQSDDLVMLCTRSIRPSTTNALQWRLCYLGIVNLALLPCSRYALGVLANFRPGLSDLMKFVSLFFFFILGPTPLRTSSRFHSHI